MAQQGTRANAEIGQASRYLTNVEMKQLKALHLPARVAARCRRGSFSTLGKFMKRASIILIVLLPLSAAVVGTSCTGPAQPRLPAVAIAIRPIGDRLPSAEEAQLVLQALKPALLQKGASIAERRDLADFVMTVSFTPATAASGSRVTVIGIESTSRNRDGRDGGETPEMKEWRRRLQQLDTGGDNRPPPGTSPADP